MLQLNIKTSKRQTLIDLLSSNVDGRKRYVLYITSCYFTSDSARKFIRSLHKNIKLSEIAIYIDRKTASAIGKDELSYFCSAFGDLEVNLYAVDTAYLFHTKAYALISYNNNDEIVCGSLVIGSANLTGSGLTARSGNIESFLDTQDIDFLNQFIQQLSELTLISIDNIEYFKSSRDYNFKYALLLEGKFIYQWRDKLNDSFSIKYTLNENGKHRIDGDDTFKRVGFNVESATISKKYFDFEYDFSHLENAKILAKKYGIETYLGYWIPSEALEALFEQNGFENFKETLKNQLNQKIESIKEQIQRDFEYFQGEGIVEYREDTKPSDSFENKTQSLFQNDLKLQRIFSKYEIFDLPYDIQQKEEIESLFDEMIFLVQSKKNKNKSMQAFLDSINDVSLDTFRQSISNSF